MHPDTVTRTDGITIAVEDTPQGTYQVVVSDATHRFVAGRFLAYRVAKNEQHFWIAGRFDPITFQESERS